MPALRKFARHVIRRRLRAVLREGAAAVPSGSDERLHELRKAVKRLRYTLEFFASLADPAASEALELLGRIQDSLGTIADADAFARTYAALFESLGRDDPRREGLKACAEAARTRRERALASLRKLWSGGAESYPERLAASISSALGSLSPKSDA